MEGLEGFGGAGRVWWSSKGSVEPEGFGGARRVWWGPKGFVSEGAATDATPGAQDLPRILRSTVIQSCLLVTLSNAAPNRSANDWLCSVGKSV